MDFINFDGDGDDCVQSKNSRKRGRPKKLDAPTINWDAVDSSLVFGEDYVDPHTGEKTIKYPSYKEIAQRLGVSVNCVWQYASKHQCMQRREEVKLRTREEYERKVIEKRALAKFKTTEDEIKAIDSYLDGFEQALAEKRVRFDNPLDYERMVRLKEFLLGNNKDTALGGSLTLEKLLQRRENFLKTQDSSSAPSKPGDRLN